MRCPAPASWRCEQTSCLALAGLQMHTTEQAAGTSWVRTPATPAVVPHLRRCLAASSPFSGVCVWPAAVMYDYDLLNENDEIGRVSIPVRDLTNGEEVERWIEIKQPQKPKSDGGLVRLQQACVSCKQHSPAWSFSSCTGPESASRLASHRGDMQLLCTGNTPDGVLGAWAL